MKSTKEGYVTVCIDKRNNLFDEIPLEQVMFKGKPLIEYTSNQEEKIKRLEANSEIFAKKLDIALKTISVLLETAKINLTKEELLVLRNKDK